MIRSLLLLVVLCSPTWAQEAPRIRDVIYGRKSGMALTMDIVKPAKPNGVGLLVMLSGGFASDISFMDSSFKPVNFKAFLDKGHTLFFVCHGSQPKFTIGEIVPDIHRAARYIRTNAKTWNVDPDKLGVLGASSGGYLSLSLGTGGADGLKDATDEVERASSRVQAVACFFPPTDLANYGKPGQTFLEFERAKPFRHVLGSLDKPKEEQLKLMKKLSPINAITKETPPTLIIHGDADILVPLEQSERFIAKLKENGVTHELIVRPKAGHGWANQIKDYEIFAEWFEKHLAKGELHREK